MIRGCQGLRPALRAYSNKGELKFSSDFEGEQMMLESSYMEGELDSRPYQLSNVRVKFAGGKMNVESLSYDWVGNVGNVVANVEAYEKAMDGGAVKGSVDVVAESVVVDPILVWWENRPDDGGAQAIMPFYHMVLILIFL